MNLKSWFCSQHKGVKILTNLMMFPQFIPYYQRTVSLPVSLCSWKTLTEASEVWRWVKGPAHSGFTAGMMVWLVQQVRSHYKVNNVLSLLLWNSGRRSHLFIIEMFVFHLLLVSPVWPVQLAAHLTNWTSLTSLDKEILPLIHLD